MASFELESDFFERYRLYWRYFHCEFIKKISINKKNQDKLKKGDEMRNKDKTLILQDKLKRIANIKERIELADGICFSIEDLNDAYLEAKINDLNSKMEQIIDNLSKANDRHQYQRMYRELEDLEEIIYLLNKKHSKTYLKAKKWAEKKPN